MNSYEIEQLIDMKDDLARGLESYEHMDKSIEKLLKRTHNTLEEMIKNEDT